MSVTIVPPSGARTGGATGGGGDGGVDGGPVGGITGGGIGGGVCGVLLPPQHGKNAGGGAKPLDPVVKGGEDSASIKGVGRSDQIGGGGGRLTAAAMG